MDRGDDTADSIIKVTFAVIAIVVIYIVIVRNSKDRFHHHLSVIGIAVP